MKKQPVATIEAGSFCHVAHPQKHARFSTYTGEKSSL
jgi:hypothetical protein